MPALFPTWSNAAYGLALASISLTGAALVVAPMLYVRTDYGTHQHRELEQPVAFDHRHHVRDDGIQCLYCHSEAEHSARAGIPSTSVCMGCHGQVWPRSELLAPVRDSYMSGRPIAWKRVYDVPDFVYFHHGVHVQRGVPCSRCHGAVEDMARVSRATPLTMEWCLDCHFKPPLPGAHQGRALTSLTTCSACHR
jgi:hypothetical protein